MPSLNPTHDPARRSWVASANHSEADFPIQNLPFGRFRRRDGEVRTGVAIGDRIVDLAAALAAGLLDGAARAPAEAAVGDLRGLLELGNAGASALRARLSALLLAGGPDQAAAGAAADRILVAQAEVEMILPTTVRQFSDMCVSTFHIGRLSGNDDRGQPICPPVFRTLPVGYDGRATSVVVSGTPVRRPNGLWTEQVGGTGDPRFGPEPRQDYELEMGAWLGGPDNPLGEPTRIAAAADRLFGLCLLNDWSARGIQFWENMLGPFLGKSLATTVSPWIVTMEALAPFRAAAFQRPAGDPPVPAHLLSDADQRDGGLDIALEARLRPHGAAGKQDAVICRTNFRHMYWTFAQMVTHHSSNGCSLGPGDLIGSGTCSGPALAEAACLLEANVEGPLSLPNGDTRLWLADGDTVILRGRASRDGYVPIGFGEATGRLMPAPDPAA
ncbi:MAG: fumarylacetoacetase [Lysobacter sp.]|nr:fumarylacetoacetase [Lysobacter sp.]